MCIDQQLLHLADVLGIPVNDRAVANVLSRLGNGALGGSVKRPVQVCSFPQDAGGLQSRHRAVSGRDATSARTDGA